MRITAHIKLATVTLCSIAILAGCGGEQPTPEPTAAPPAEPTPAPAAMVARGKEVFVEKTCQSCHVIKGFEKAVGMVGPELTRIYTDAPKIIASDAYKSSQGTAKTAVEYIRESILNPNAFIYPDCPTGPCQPNLMIQNFKETISDADLEALIAYLVTLK